MPTIDNSNRPSKKDKFIERMESLGYIVGCEGEVISVGLRTNKNYLFVNATSVRELELAKFDVAEHIIRSINEMIMEKF